MSTSFADLGVPTRLVERLAQRSITEPFPVQVAAIPDAMAGRDVVAQAETGSGKTLAFALPLLSDLDVARPQRPVALVLVPTRELAAQVQREIAALSDDHRRVLAIYGGTPYQHARKALRAGVDIVVACPGRLEDLLDQGALDLSAVTRVVVDEADRMADMGFLPAVRRLLGATKATRQVMLFSATMGRDVDALVRAFTREPVRHDISSTEVSGEVTHRFWRVERDARVEATAELVAEHGRAIVFTRTKHGADRLAKQLGQRGVRALALHGDRSQAQRERALRAFQNGEAQVLVATDVAARGIHIEALPVVVHFDPPAQATDYLHRSGRTGRAGAPGAVVSLVSSETVGATKRLQRELGLAATMDSRAPSAPRDFPAPPVVKQAPRVDGRDAPAPPPRERTTRRRSQPPVPARAHRGERPAHAKSGPHGPKRAVVSFFNDRKGFGFASDDAGDDLFIHYTSIVGEGFRALSQGAQITFDEARGPKGREAKNVRVLNARRERVG